MIDSEPTTAASGLPDPALDGYRIPAQSFASVLEAARLGAPWAFSVLYRAHNHLLLRYFAARVPGEAEDLASEVWLAAARRIGTFEGDAPALRSWLFTIAHHRLVQHWRDSARRPPSGPLPGAGPGTGTVAGPDVPAGGPGDGDPAEAVGAALSAQDAIRRIVSVLGPDQAEVVLLRVLGGLTVDQVAATLGKRPGAVRVLQHRALKKLADSEIFVEGVTP